MNDRSGFSDPVKVKEQRPKNHPHNEGKTPWDFKCPSYDQRTSNFVNAGTHYGIGHKQPVGREGNPEPKAAVLPTGRVSTMRDDDKG